MTRSSEAPQSPLEKIRTTGDTTLKTIMVTITPHSDLQIPGTGAYTVPHGTGTHGHTVRGDITIADGTAHGTTEAGMTHGTMEDTTAGIILSTTITTDGMIRITATGLDSLL